MRDHASEHPSKSAAVTSIASKIGCTSETLKRWVAQEERDTGQREDLMSDDRSKMKALEREVRELKRANEILKKASAFFAPPGSMALPCV